MQLTKDGAWLVDARHVLSPNCDDRPADSEISLIVVHGISLPPGEYGGPWIDDLFTNRLDHDAHPYFAGIKDLRVSSHVLIRRDGRQKAGLASIAAYVAAIGGLLVVLVSLLITHAWDRLRARFQQQHLLRAAPARAERGAQLVL